MGDMFSELEVGCKQRLAIYNGDLNTAHNKTNVNYVLSCNDDLISFVACVKD